MSKSSYFFVGIYLHKITVLKTLKVLRPPPVCIVDRFHWYKCINVFQKNCIFSKNFNLSHHGNANQPSDSESDCRRQKTENDLSHS